MSYQGLTVFQRKRMAECLTAQAHLCERAASLSWNEETAIELEHLARECNDAATSKRPQGAIVSAAWPTTHPAK
jgi:hypothetical protein